jgi:tetratricopeptide (TPR) repeat protein
VSGGGAAVAVALLLLVTTACASKAPTFASRFITEGTPTLNVGGIETTIYGQAPRPPRASMPPLPEMRKVGSRHSSNLSALEAASPALRRALSALAQAPTSANYLSVAAAYRAEGVRDKAFDYLTEGLADDRYNPALHDALARLWRDWGFPDRALSAATQAVYHAPQSPEARNTLGTVLWALGQRAEAGRAFEAATALDAGAWYAWSNRCEVALTAGRTVEATAFCRKAAALKRRSQETRR